MIPSTHLAATEDRLAQTRHHAGYLEVGPDDPDDDEEEDVDATFDGEFELPPDAPAEVPGVDLVSFLPFGASF